MNEREMQSLLALAAKRLHTTPEALRAAAENGDLQNITGSQNNAAASQLNRVLSDPEAAKKLLSTPAAQKLFEALGGKNRKEVSGGGRSGRSRTIHFKRPAKHGAAAERDELAWHESAASPCPGSAARAAKTGGRRTAQFAEHAKQQRSDDGDAFARRAAFGKREPRR